MVTEINYKLLSTTRVGIRKELVEKFLEEKAGTGEGDECSKYNYIVEEISGYRIILKRPATLNKGFDFTVHTDGINFIKEFEDGYDDGKRRKSHDYPSHINVKKLLERVKDSNECDYNIIKNEIKKIFFLEEYDLNNVKNINFIDKDGCQRPIGIILYAIKWLFIEQDVTYWNWSGRNMLWNKLKEKGLV